MVKRSALCRSQRELSNEYLLDEIGVDTAENEPVEVCGKIQCTIHSPPRPQHRFRPPGRRARGCLAGTAARLRGAVLSGLHQVLRGGIPLGRRGRGERKPAVRSCYCY